MTTTTRQTLYQYIVDNIRQRHAAGEFAPGDQMYSVDQTCRHFNVSATTAVRAIEELKRLGLITSIKGKGTYFSGPPRVRMERDEPTAIERVAIVSSHPGFFRAGFQGDICRGVERAATEAGLPLTTHHVPTDDASGVERLHFTPTPSEALVIYGAELSLSMYSLLAEQNLRTVVADGLVNMAHCVVTDNYDGMRQLLKHLLDLGHRRILLGARHPRSPNTTNENERISAFRYFAEDHNLKTHVLAADDHDAIFQHLSTPTAATAILFTQDAPALDFIEAANRRGVNVPNDVSVTGFDGFATGNRNIEKLTTLAVDSESIGRAAVQLLLSDNVKQAIKIWRRQRGTLQIGETTGPANTR